MKTGAIGNQVVWARVDLNHRPHAYSARSRDARISATTSFRIARPEELRSVDR